MTAGLRILHFAFCILQFAILPAIADGVRGPVSPRESLEHIVVEDGLRVELVAHEPQVLDPVAIRFDEDGRLWVVEMRDYPTVDTPGIDARSRISVLTDRDGDGFFETATVFADDLPYATGLQPWRGGVFVTMAGQIAYLKDTTGDGTADSIEPWYIGFSEANTQLRANHPRLGLDNHVYVAQGLRGGRIVGAEADAPPVSLRGRDFRFNPLTRQFEAVSGVGQFGLTFDDYGNRFVCSNRNPAMHVVLEDRYLRKNPLAAVAAVSTDVAKAGAESQVFPIGIAWTTSHLHAGQFTAACGVTVYRGDALPEAYYGNIFVCEPTGHLVHREIVRPRGVTFRSRSAALEPADGADDGEPNGIEFFASRDEWCCPVSLEVGPDGALYVVDMYRAIIEHPEWMPSELQQRPNLVHGNDRGRIYRVVPEGFRRPPAPRLSLKTSEALVDLLAHPGAWWRETAARLLLERQDESVAPKLRRMALEHESHLARIHAVRLLEGLQRLDEELLLAMLQDAHPRVLEQAIVAAEAHVGKSSLLREAISQLAAHPDARVRFQALLTATPLPQLPEHRTDRWELEAMRIATGRRGGTVLATILQNTAALQANVRRPKRFVAELARLAAASPDAAERARGIDALLGSDEYRRVGLAGFFAEATRRGAPLRRLLDELDDRQRREIEMAFQSARHDAADVNLRGSVRREAIDLLAYFEAAAETLVPIALDDPRPAMRLRAIAALGKNPYETQAWRPLLERFSAETPVVQSAMLDGVFASLSRTLLLLDEIAAGRIRATEVDGNRLKLLLNHSVPEVKRRAEQLFAEAMPADREKALAEYQVVLTLEADVARGRGVFERHCASCHQVGGVGVAFAPDISDSREKTIGQLLTDIIQPNRAIDANYFSYTAVTVDGLVHTGVLAAETSTSVTLKQAEGKEITLRRDEIEELRSDGVSFMPEGLEKNIPPQDMADLIGFIKNWRYLEEPPQPTAAGR